MRRAALPLALVLAVVAAGCLAGGGDPQADPSAAEAGAEAPGSDTSGGDGAGSAGANATTRPEATLEEAPGWRVGDWWTATVTSVFTGQEHTTTFVVADRHGDTYHVGLAAEDFSDGAVLAGWPPVGEVAASDLSFRLHGERFQPLKFPLREGTSWQATYEAREGFEAQVVSAGAGVAEIAMTREVQTAFGSTTSSMNLTYDASAQAITAVEDDQGRTYEVTDHGTGYEGKVVVPHGREQHLDARVLGAFEGIAVTTNVAGPTSSTTISKPEASLRLLVGSVPVGGTPPPGLYQEVAQAPSGEAFQMASAGTQGLSESFLHADEAAGRWEFQHVAGGFGGVATEIVAYEPIEVTLDGNATASNR